MEELKENESYPIKVANFISWLEENLATKYEQSLHGVKSRFLCIFSLFRTLLHGFLEISKLVKADPSSIHIKQISDNAIHIIQSIFMEYPTCLNFSYCEHFLNTIREWVDSLTMCIHALCHAEANTAEITGIFLIF